MLLLREADSSIMVRDDEEEDVESEDDDCDCDCDCCGRAEKGMVPPVFDDDDEEATSDWFLFGFIV